MTYIEGALAAQYNAKMLKRASMTMLNSAGLYSEARTFIQEASYGKPWNPMAAVVWDRGLDLLEDKVDEVEANGR